MRGLVRNVVICLRCFGRLEGLRVACNTFDKILILSRDAWHVDKLFRDAVKCYRLLQRQHGAALVWVWSRNQH